MPRRPKGPRLYFREPRRDAAGRVTHAGVWLIRDGEAQISTGCAEHDRDGAEKALERYLGAKWSPPGELSRSPDDPVWLADVLALYSVEKGPTSSDPVVFGSQIGKLGEWWGGKTVAEVRRTTCNEYVEWRTAQRIRHARRSERRISKATARRELEQLAAAIGYWHAEHPLKALPKLTYPEKSPARCDFMTRSQAAAMLGAALGFYRDEDGRLRRRGRSARANRAHVARFLLMGIYSGTRHTAMLSVMWLPSVSSAWVDLERGVMHRRGTGETETRKRRPPVRIQHRLLAHMRRWREIDRTRTDGDGAPLTHVIHHGGEPIAGKVRTGWNNVRKDAGLGPEFVPHVMRHTCGTWLAQAGVDIWEAAGYLGMSAKTFERVYGHHHPDFQTEAAQALSSRNR